VTGPRYIAHFRATDGCRERIDCDAVNLEEGYLLFNRINREAGAPARAETVACFAPGAWAGYVLEPAPHTEAVEYASDDREPCNAEPDSDAEADRRPEFGDVLHIHQRDYGCRTGSVLEVHPECLEVAVDADDPRAYQRYITHTHDETRTADGSWHWPCDGDAAKNAPTEPKPDGTTEITVRVGIDGRALYDLILPHAVRDTRRTGRPNL
jgi:hypothetical protein